MESDRLPSQSADLEERTAVLRCDMSKLYGFAVGCIAIGENVGGCPLLLSHLRDARGMLRDGMRALENVERQARYVPVMAWQNWDRANELRRDALRSIQAAVADANADTLE